jgi:hypothetical protein
MSALLDAPRTLPPAFAERGGDEPSALAEVLARAGLGARGGRIRLEDLPFGPGDVTGGSEIELQTVVMGAPRDADLPRTILDSRYHANLEKRVRRGDVDRALLRDLDACLRENTEGVWDNSWVRFPEARLGAYAAEVFRLDLRADREDPASAPRGDVGRFYVEERGERWLRLPVSYVLKLALAELIGAWPELEPLAGRMMGHLLSDNTSPESFSFHVCRLEPATGGGAALARETAKRHLMMQWLLQYADRRFGLSQLGQHTRIFFSPHPPVRQRRLNSAIPDSFYRELFMSPCLSGWRRGEVKHEYMHLCHQVLSRSQLNTLAKLREAGILRHNLVMMPQISNISLASNGTHISLGSRRLGRALRDPASGFDARHEKAVGDLVIKISEHFLPLFAGAVSAAPYRLGFEDMHPERALGFLPHQLDYTHLRMLWRRWKKKAGLRFCGQPMGPSGIGWVDRLVSGVLRHRGDYVHDFRLLDYPCTLLSTDESPAFDGRPGNQDRLKSDLADQGVFDRRMSFYAPVKLREQAVIGYTGFESRLHSVFPSLLVDMAMAADVQTLITALAYRWIASGEVTHADIPDTPAVESERRQVLFSAAVGVPTFYVRLDSPNRFLLKLLENVPGTRASGRYAGYRRVKLADFRRALVERLRRDGAELVEACGFGTMLDDLHARVSDPAGGAAGRITGAVLASLGRASPMSCGAREFNHGAERYYRETLRTIHSLEGLDVMLEDLDDMRRTGAFSEARYAGLARGIADGACPVVWAKARGADAVGDRLIEADLRRMLALLIMTFDRDRTRHEAPGDAS